MINVLDLIKFHEGLRLKAYKCTAGVWTIGYGHTKGVKEGDTCTAEEAEAMLIDDLIDVITDLNDHIPWWRFKLNHNRQAVLIDMCFNLGIHRLLKFKETLRLISIGEYVLAAEEMLRSKWAEQVKSRAVRLSRTMREG